MAGKLSPGAMKKLQKEKLEVEKHAATASRKAQSEAKKTVGAKRKPAVKKEEDSDDDTPLIQSRKRAAPKKNGVKKEEQSDEDVPLAKKARGGNTAVKKAVTAAAAKKTKAKPMKKEETPGNGTPEEGEEEEEEYAWWAEQEKADNTKKWTTLEHNGVLFPPPYEPLPKNVKLKYDGVPVTLAIEAEEVAGFFGTMLSSDHVKNEVFCQNFFADFSEVLKKSGGAKGPDGKVRPRYRRLTLSLIWNSPSKSPNSKNATLAIFSTIMKLRGKKRSSLALLIRSNLKPKKMPWKSPICIVDWMVEKRKSATLGSSHLDSSEDAESTRRPVN